MKHNHPLNNCIFCKIVEKVLPSYLFLENDHAIAVLDAFPVSSGHALILTKKHYQNLMETPDDVLADVIKLAKKAALLLDSKLDKIGGFNYLSNQNEIANQTVFHTHMHVIPKYQKELGFCFEEKRVNKIQDHDFIIKKIKS